MQNFNNKLEITYTLADGRVFGAKRGKLDQFSYRKNGYDKLGFAVEFDWGLHTNYFYKIEKKHPDLIGRFMLEVMEATGGSASDQIVGRPLYILFQEERRSVPLGLASLDGYSSIIFNDFFGWD